MENNDTRAELFSEGGKQLIQVARQVWSTAGKPRFSFMPEPEYADLIRENLAGGLRLYWLEILYRARLSSLIALLRVCRWVDGVRQGHESKNLLAFAASFRGLLEVAADTWSSYRKICGSLTVNYSHIRRAIDGRAKAAFVAPDLEGELIHFMYARKLTKSEPAPVEHRARTATDYLELLAQGAGEIVKECYAELCNLTHPAAHSVLSFVQAHEAGNLLEFWPEADADRINDLCVRYGPATDDILMLSVNEPLVALKLLNSFGHRALITPVMDTIDLSDIPAWRSARKTLDEYERSR